jgi:hypothetical protein
LPRKREWTIKTADKPTPKKDLLKRPRKLTWREVGTIRDAYRNHDMTMAALAAWYGVSVSLISAIVNNKVWKE